MRILVTNDDSISSKGLHELIKLAKGYGEVLVVAPKEEQSAKSHSIDIKNGLSLEEVDLGLDVKAYSLSSTPADCVRAAYYALNYDFDIVFSGINNGLNLGDDILYSGTVAAIFEAARIGKKGIAFSSNTNNHLEVVKNFENIMNLFFQNDLLSLNLIYNVNVPNEPIGIKFTKQGNTHFNTKFAKENDLYYQRGNPVFEKDLDNLDSDVCAIFNHYISITPLVIDRTNYQVLEILKKKE